MSQRVKRPNRTDDGCIPTKRRKRPTMEEEEAASLAAAASWQPRPFNDLKSIYNRTATEAPAELFRKDLISAMKLPDSEPLASDEYWVIVDQWKQEWERGVQVPVNPDSLPEPSVSVRQSSLIKPYQEFKIPKTKYIRITKDEHFYIEKHVLSTAPAKSEAACSYDLDETDVAWLKLLNGERATCGLNPISEEKLERVIERLEVNCWDKIQSILRNEEGLGIEYDENVICDVCRSPDSEEGNEMVFCDSCNICVHQACYGITRIPEGQWLCGTCALSQRPECILCPNKGGAMKATRSGQKWAHVSCALWIPEVSIGCVEKMEPITKVSSIPQSRWALICVLCRERVGACIQCSVKTCKTAYHVTCAFKHGLEMRAIIEDENADDGVKLRSYCEKHSKTSKKEKSSVCSGSEDDDNKRKKRKDMTSEEKNQARAARLHEIEAEFDKHVSIKDVNMRLDVDNHALQYIYNYWKLKRRAGCNKPLLPPKSDEADMLSHKQEHADLEKMKTFVQLRQDLERVRNLCYMVSRREKLSRTYFRMREQTFHKQAAVLSSHSLPTAVTHAIIEANHGASIYDGLYSHGKYENDFEVVLARIAGSAKDENVNGLLKSNNPYKRTYFNGSSRRSTSAGSSSSENIHRTTSDDVKRKRKTSSMRHRSIRNFESSGDEIVVGSKSRLHQVRNDLGMSGTESDEYHQTRSESQRSKVISSIYSESDSSNASNSQQSSRPRTKAAVKEFINKPSTSSRSTAKKKPFIPSDLFVPQREAAKKASVNMKTTTTRVVPKEKEPASPEPAKTKTAPTKKEAKVVTPKKEKAVDVFDIENEKEDEILSYVPQRQAAKKATESIKSGLGKPVQPPVEPEKPPAKLPEHKRKSSTSSTSASSSSDSSDSSTETDVEPQSETKRTTTTKDWPFLDKAAKPEVSVSDRTKKCAAPTRTEPPRPSKSSHRNTNVRPRDLTNSQSVLESRKGKQDEVAEPSKKEIAKPGVFASFSKENKRLSRTSSDSDSSSKSETQSKFSRLFEPPRKSDSLPTKTLEKAKRFEPDDKQAAKSHKKQEHASRKRYELDDVKTQGLYDSEKLDRASEHLQKTHVEPHKRLFETHGKNRVKTSEAPVSGGKAEKCSPVRKTPEKHLQKSKLHEESHKPHEKSEFKSRLSVNVSEARLPASGRKISEKQLFNVNRSPETLSPDHSSFKTTDRSSRTLYSPDRSRRKVPEKYSPDHFNRKIHSPEHFDEEHSSRKLPVKHSSDYLSRKNEKQLSSRKIPEKHSPDRFSHKTPENLPDHSSRKIPEKRSPDRLSHKTAEELSPERKIHSSDHSTRSMPDKRLSDVLSRKEKNVSRLAIPEKQLSDISSRNTPEPFPDFTSSKTYEPEVPNKVSEKYSSDVLSCKTSESYLSNISSHNSPEQHFTDFSSRNSPKQQLPDFSMDKPDKCWSNVSNRNTPEKHSSDVSSLRASDVSSIKESQSDLSDVSSIKPPDISNLKAAEKHLSDALTRKASTNTKDFTTHSFDKHLSNISSSKIHEQLSYDIPKAASELQDVSKTASHKIPEPNETLSKSHEPNKYLFKKNESNACSIVEAFPEGYDKQETFPESYNKQATYEALPKSYEKQDAYSKSYDKQEAYPKSYDKQEASGFSQTPTKPVSENPNNQTKLFDSNFEFHSQTFGVGIENQQTGVDMFGGNNHHLLSNQTFDDFTHNAIQTEVFGAELSKRLLEQSSVFDKQRGDLFPIRSENFANSQFGRFNNQPDFETQHTEMFQQLPRPNFLDDNQRNNQLPNFDDIANENRQSMFDPHLGDQRLINQTGGPQMQQRLGNQSDLQIPHRLGNPTDLLQVRTELFPQPQQDFAMHNVTNTETEHKAQEPVPLSDFPTDKHLNNYKENVQFDVQRPAFFNNTPVETFAETYKASKDPLLTFGEYETKTPEQKGDQELPCPNVVENLFETEQFYQAKNKPPDGFENKNIFAGAEMYNDVQNAVKNIDESFVFNQTFPDSIGGFDLDFSKRDEKKVEEEKVGEVVAAKEAGDLLDFDMLEDSFGISKGFAMGSGALFKEDSKEDSARETLNLVEKLRMELSKKSTGNDVEPDPPDDVPKENVPQGTLASTTLQADERWVPPSSTPSPYADIHPQAKWADSQIMPARRSSSSSAASSTCSETPEQPNDNLTQFSGVFNPVSLFPPTSTNFNNNPLPFPSPGAAAMFPPAFPPLKPVETICTATAAFTSSEHNMALTAAMVNEVAVTKPSGKKSPTKPTRTSARFQNKSPDKSPRMEKSPRTEPPKNNVRRGQNKRRGGATQRGRRRKPTPNDTINKLVGTVYDFDFDDENDCMGDLKSLRERRKSDVHSPKSEKVQTPPVVATPPPPPPPPIEPVLPGPVDMRTYNSFEETHAEAASLTFAKLDEPGKVSLSDSRNQLKVKIKGPIANYTESVPPPTMASSNTAASLPVSVNPGTSSNLRRMRKKELLRQYWTQENMDDNATVPGVAAVPTVAPINRTIITIPKAVASMTSIPTRDDYRDYRTTDEAVAAAKPPTKARPGGLSRELKQLDLSTTPDVGDSHRRPPPRNNNKKPGATPGAAPKLKIKIAATGNVSTDPSKPPKKRLSTLPQPSVEDYKRDSMKFRKMVMANFDDRRKKKKDKSSKHRKRKKHRPEIIKVPNTTKLIIRFSRKPDSECENKTEDDSATANVRPIKLKIARCQNSSAYVMKNDEPPETPPVPLPLNKDCEVR